jgi:hypothetical protein
MMLRKHDGGGHGAAVELFVQESAMATYDELKAKVQELARDGRLSPVPTREQRIDFAYGNTKLENDNVTIEMVTRAVDAVDNVDR